MFHAIKPTWAEEDEAYWSVRCDSTGTLVELDQGYYVDYALAKDAADLLNLIAGDDE